MPNNVIDLDVLKPAKKFIKLGGKEIDVSYIPTGITFEIDEIVNLISKLDLKKVQTDRKEGKHAFDLSLKLCATFCGWRYPECTVEWFEQNTNVNQVSAFAEEIKKLLSEAYKGAAAYSKNVEAVK